MFQFARTFLSRKPPWQLFKLSRKRAVKFVTLHQRLLRCARARSLALSSGFVCKQSSPRCLFTNLCCSFAALRGGKTCEIMVCLLKLSPLAADRGHLERYLSPARRRVICQTMCGNANLFIGGARDWKLVLRSTWPTKSIMTGRRAALAGIFIEFSCKKNNTLRRQVRVVAP